jgi:hypothetical protein
MYIKNIVFLICSFLPICSYSYEESSKDIESKSSNLDKIVHIETENVEVNINSDDEKINAQTNKITLDTNNK